MKSRTVVLNLILPGGEPWNKKIGRTPKVKNYFEEFIIKLKFEHNNKKHKYLGGLFAVFMVLPFKFRGN